MAREQKAYVFIYLPGETVAVPAGIFTHYPDDGVGRFAYGRLYLERPNALPVDPVALPLGGTPKDVTTNGGVYGAFRDSAPDYWGRLVIAADLKTRPEALSEMDYLLHANASRIGCLDFREGLNQGEPLQGPPTYQSMHDLLRAAEQLQNGLPVDQNLLRLLEQGSSVGGARPKCTVERDDGLWIAKFPSKGDTINSPRVEYATMNLARACGIVIPTIQLETIGGKDVLILERFDRRKTKTGYARLGFISALSLMDWDDRERPLWSYISLADTMRATILAQPAQLSDLFRRVVFNILCRNTDDHPRNHGFLWGARGLELSPAYDLVPAPARLGVNTEFDLSMSLGERGREASLENALTMTSRFGLTRDQAEKIIGDMVEGTRRWEDHYLAHGVIPDDVDAIRACFQRAG